MNDQELEKLAQRLGAEAAERLDVERTAQAVAQRLRDAPPLARTAWAWTRSAWLKIAATIVLAVGAGLLLRGPRQPTLATGTAVVPVAEESGDLTADQLREALDSVDRPLGDENLGDTGFDGLSAEELRALLRTLEG